MILCVTDADAADSFTLQTSLVIFCNFNNFDALVVRSSWAKSFNNSTRVDPCLLACLTIQPASLWCMPACLFLFFIICSYCMYSYIWQNLEQKTYFTPVVYLIPISIWFSFHHVNKSSMSISDISYIKAIFMFLPKSKRKNLVTDLLLCNVQPRVLFPILQKNYPALVSILWQYNNATTVWW